MRFEKFSNNSSDAGVEKVGGESFSYILDLMSHLDLFVCFLVLILICHPSPVLGHYFLFPKLQICISGSHTNTAVGAGGWRYLHCTQNH